jgi:hypothetical protein
VRRVYKTKYDRKREMKFDTDVIFSCFNELDTMVYVITAAEIFEYTFPDMELKRSCKGDFKAVRLAQVNGHGDLMLLLDSKSLQVFKLDTLFTTELREPSFKTDYFVGSASFLSNDDVLLSVIKADRSDIQMRRLAKKVDGLGNVSYSLLKEKGLNLDLNTVAQRTSNNTINPASYSQCSWGSFIPMARLPNE